jgi:site-specific recombinase XerD
MPYSQTIYSDEIDKFIEDFKNYLIKIRDNDPVTADHYARDANVYLKYRLELPLNSLAELFTPEHFQGFVCFLRDRKLNNSTIKRRLIGAGRFWKYLYKYKHNAHPPMTLDDLDIKVKKVRNATRPLTPQNFFTVRKESLDGIQHIY